jgi:hypothetical protein
MFYIDKENVSRNPYYKGELIEMECKMLSKVKDNNKRLTLD